MTRHVSEEREKLAAKLRVTTEQMAHRCSVDQVLWNMHSNACLEAADLLLSTSSAERGMREALEKARETLGRASRELSENHRLILQGKRWGGETIDALDAALSPKGEG